MPEAVFPIGTCRRVVALLVRYHKRRGYTEQASAMSQFVLISASKSRGADFWNKDEYDVRLGDRSGPVQRSHHLGVPTWNATALSELSWCCRLQSDSAYVL